MKCLKILAFAALCCIALLYTGSGEENGFQANVYYPAMDMTGLICEQRAILPEKNENPVRAIIAALLDKPNGAGAEKLFGEEATLNGLEISCGIVTVDIRTNSPTDEKQRALSALAVWKTLSENTNAEAVNVLADSCALRYDGVALNTLRTLKTDSNEFDALWNAALDNRAYTVYYPLRDDNYVLPQLRALNEHKTDVNALMDHIAFTEDKEWLLLTWPDGFSRAGGFEHYWDFSTCSRRRLNLVYIDTPDAAYTISEALQISGMTRRQFLSSLTLTFSTNVPDVERLTLNVNERQISALSDENGVETKFKDGEFARRDFGRDIASIVYHIAADPVTGKFSVTQIPMDADVMLDCRSVLLESLEGLIKDDDIDGVYVLYDKAKIDLSAEYYAFLNSMKPEESKKQYYAIVNALDLNFGVSEVRFYAEGLGLTRDVCGPDLSAALRPDYGLYE